VHAFILFNFNIYSTTMKNILIAEDDAASMLYYNSVLKKVNYNTFNVTNTTNIFDIIQKNNIHLILLDIKIIPIGGIEVANILKKEYPNIKIIAQTAYSHLYFKGNERELFDLFLEKPISSSILIESIEKLLK